jgi:hypothetical protein
MPPELFVRLRLLGYTTEAIEFLGAKFPSIPWERYIVNVENGMAMRSEAHAAYWNCRAKEERGQANR